jgi:hypothetical protein
LIFEKIEEVIQRSFVQSFRLNLHASPSFVSGVVKFIYVRPNTIRKLQFGVKSISDIKAYKFKQPRVHQEDPLTYNSLNFYQREKISRKVVKKIFLTHISLST